MSTFDTAGDPAADGAYADGLDSESVTDAAGHRDAADDAETSSGAPDVIAAGGEDLGERGGEADILDGALSPGSTATDGPTGMGDAPSR